MVQKHYLINGGWLKGRVEANSAFFTFRAKTFIFEIYMHFGSTKQKIQPFLVAIFEKGPQKAAHAL